MSSTPPTTLKPKVTIWIWPTGLFPRRIMYYFRAKNITLSTLAAHNIHLIPVAIDMAAKTLKANDKYEQKPEGMSLPCMRIENGEEGGTEYVHESLAIIAFLEEVLPRGSQDIMGSTPLQRARTHDILSVLSEAILWTSDALMHSDPNTLFWSGLTESTMSASTAKDAKKRFDRLLSKLEGWVEDGVIRGGMQNLSGQGASVTLVDIVLMTSVCYAEDFYGADWIEDHGVLRIWCERAKGAEWWVSAEALKECEVSGWEAVLEK